jgi:hypothetical protein
MSSYVYPAPIAPHYKEPKNLEDCLPQARALVNTRHGRTAMGPVEKGERILIITSPDQNEYVKEASTMAFKEAGAKEVKFLCPGELTGEKERIFNVEDGWEEVQMLAEGIASGSPETADLASGMNVGKPLYEYLKKTGGYTKLFWDIGGRSQKVSVLKEYGKIFRANWLFNNWEEFLSRAWTFPNELTLEIERRLTDPEGTFLEFPLSADDAKRWQMAAWSPGHLFMDPLQATVMESMQATLTKTRSPEIAPVFPDINGVLAGTSNHRGFIPRMELHIEHGRLVEVKGGGKYGDNIREIMDKYKNIQWPGYPGKGYFWFCDAALCTMVKAFRRSSDIFNSYWGFPNIAERNRAGVFHLGIGSRRHFKEHLGYAKENNLPSGHIHVHNYFVTYEIKLRGSENWYKIVDKGFPVAMRDPDIRAIAFKYGDPEELLRFDWVPPLPGINCDGEYLKDYAPDPVSYLKKRMADNKTI